MDEQLKAKITAAVNAAIDAVDADQKQGDSPAEDPAPEPHRFGQFRIPPDRHIGGFFKWPVTEELS